MKSEKLKNKGFLYLLIIVICVVLFGYRLGWGSLQPWDEAWFADVARNVLRGHVILLEAFRGPFIDHPPLGFWTMAVSMRILGVNEFSARLPSAFFGVFSMVLLLKVGKELKNTWMGLGAVVIVLSSRWYLLRIRSGNLDSLLMLTQLIVFYWSYRARSYRQLLWGYLGLGLGLMSKTAIALSLLPFLLWKTWQINKKKKINLKWISLYVLFSFGLIGSWYGIVVYKYGFEKFVLMIHNVVFRGEAGGGVNAGDFLVTIKLWQPLLHRWFKPLIISLGLGLLIFRKRRHIRWIYGYLGVVALPFFLSDKEKIWHIVPLTIPAALLISDVMFSILEGLGKKLRSSKTTFICLVGLLGLMLLAGLSWYELRPELIPNTDSVSDQEYFGEKTRDTQGKLVLDVFGDIYPAAGFYADREIALINKQEQKINLQSFSSPIIIYTSDSYPECDLLASRREFKAYLCE